MRQVSSSTQLHVYSTLNYIQNYSTKFEIHSRNPVLICYYNDCDTYHAQYFPSSSSSIFIMLLLENLLLTNTFCAAPDTDRQDVALC
jgi:hypothetical protein